MWIDTLYIYDYIYICGYMYVYIYIYGLTIYILCPYIILSHLSKIQHRIARKTHPSPLPLLFCEAPPKAQVGMAAVLFNLSCAQRKTLRFLTIHWVYSLWYVCTYVCMYVRTYVCMYIITFSIVDRIMPYKSKWLIHLDMLMPGLK